MDNLNFTSNSEARVQSWDELKDIVDERYSYNVQDVKLGDLSINDKGQICRGDDNFSITEDGFKHFCTRILRIPDPFANMIPFDLLQHNVKEICKDRASDDVILHFNEKHGNLVNVSKGDFMPIPHIDLIGEMEKITPGMTQAIIDESGLNIDTTDPVLEGFTTEIEPAVGDISKVGFTYNMSQTGFHSTSARLFLYRLVCANGMVAPRSWGNARLRTKLTRPLTTSVNSFFHQIGSLGERAEDMAHCLKTLMESNFNTANAFKTWSKLDKLTDSGSADVFFELPTDQRVQYFDEEKLRKREMKNNPLAPVQQPKEVPVNMYKVYNNITHGAKKFDRQTRRQLEAFAGEFMTEMGRA
tara:strand:- start:2776 stop:3846 length:1071 start_codon:yes stop_codon:yes gene_type:complete